VAAQHVVDALLTERCAVRVPRVDQPVRHEQHAVADREVCVRNDRWFATRQSDAMSTDRRRLCR
jgi:hypothetical protein